MEKKYELTDEILEVGGHVLHRIKALRDFGNVKKGGTGEELITKAYNDSEESGREYERIVKYVESI